MRVLRRRDGASLEATLTTTHAGAFYDVPVLVIDGDSFGQGETAGYLLTEADAGERAELRRWGYDLGDVQTGPA